MTSNERGQEGEPVTYASRTLTETEKRYAQIEKEMLAVTYGLDKYHQYTFGRLVPVTMRHRTLGAITKKPLSKAQQRLQNIPLRERKSYTYDLTWIPGNKIPLADALTRTPFQEAS